MYFGTPNRALLRTIAAGAAMLAAAACSRSDRAGTGSDTTQVQSGAAATTDTQSVATKSTSPNQATPGRATPADSASNMNNSAPSSTSERTSETGKSLAGTRRKTGQAARTTSDTGVSGYRAMGQDSSSGNGSAQAAGSSRDTVTVGDSSHVGKTGNRLEPTAASGEANADSVSNQADSTRIRPPEDSSETVGTASTDSGAPEMARDTSTSLAQADTTAPQPSDTSAQAAQDSSAVQAQVDTTQQTEMAQQAPVDSAAPVQAQVDTANAANDTESTAQNSEMAQQPADTAAVPVQADTAQVNVTNQNAQADTGNIQADTATSDVSADAAPAAAAGVQSGNIVTGADAVALVTREGRRCAVVNDDADRRDLASSPATLNPCGTGTMTLPRVQVEER